MLRKFVIALGKAGEKIFIQSVPDIFHRELYKGTILSGGYMYINAPENCAYCCSKSEEFGACNLQDLEEALNNNGWMSFRRFDENFKVYFSQSESLNEVVNNNILTNYENN